MINPIDQFFISYGFYILMNLYFILVTVYFNNKLRKEEEKCINHDLFSPTICKDEDEDNKENKIKEKIEKIKNTLYIKYKDISYLVYNKNLLSLITIIVFNSSFITLNIFYLLSSFLLYWIIQNILYILQVKDLYRSNSKIQKQLIKSPERLSYLISHCRYFKGETQIYDCKFKLKNGNDVSINDLAKKYKNRKRKELEKTIKMPKYGWVSLDKYLEKRRSK